MMLPLVLGDQLNVQHPTPLNGGQLPDTVGMACRRMAPITTWRTRMRRRLRH